ncbi:MAG TPA: hypothetical protein VIF14_13695 [Alphaproteobacteria bacterium]|jgi:hypothetical protein
MNALEAEGFILVGGPLEGTSDVLLIARAADEAEARARLAPDPWAQKELLRLGETVFEGRAAHPAAAGGAAHLRKNA